MLVPLLLTVIVCAIVVGWFLTRDFFTVPISSEKSRGPGKSASAREMNLPLVIHSILDLARWSPSGDNDQPWEFECINEFHIRVYYDVIITDRVYDADSFTQVLSLGCLLETIEIASSKFGLKIESIQRDLTYDGDYKKLESNGHCKIVFDIRFTHMKSNESESPLASVIESRITERKWMSTRSLTEQEKFTLRQCLNKKNTIVSSGGVDVGVSRGGGGGESGDSSESESTSTSSTSSSSSSSSSTSSLFDVEFRESFSERWTIASLLYRTSDIRLSMPEAFPFHVASLEWHASYSTERMPIATTPLDFVTRWITYWGTLGGWKRMTFLNTIFGHATTRIELDLLPGLMCSSHCIISMKNEPKTLDEFIEVGRCLGRFWLTLTHLGLRMQPEIMPLVFARYVRNGIRPSKDELIQQKMIALEKEVKQVVETQQQQQQQQQTTNGQPSKGYPVLMLRCGESHSHTTTTTTTTTATVTSRALRKPLEDLMYRQ